MEEAIIIARMTFRSARDMTSFDAIPPAHTSNSWKSLKPQTYLDQNTTWLSKSTSLRMIYLPWPDGRISMYSTEAFSRYA